MEGKKTKWKTLGSFPV